MVSAPSRNLSLSNPDVLLMLEFQKGGKASFEALTRKYYGRVFNFILRIVLRRDAAEDLTQEVFIKVYHSGDQYKPQAKFQTLVFTIAKNLALNEDKNFLPADEELARDETARLVKEAIHSLPENQRIAVILRRYENFSYEEIAESLNCSTEAVKPLLSRAKETLKKSFRIT